MIKDVQEMNLFMFCWEIMSNQVGKYLAWCLKLLLHLVLFTLFPEIYVDF